MADGIVISGSNDTRITIGNGQPTVWSWANGWVTPGDFSLIEEFVSGSRIYVKPGGNVGIGTTSPQYTLAVNGTIGAKDVIVTNSGWPDYVFRPGYRLRPLNEVGAYIRAHQRLPDIPSEAEVKEKGVSVGEMQAKLLAKIEELTLHMIRADERSSRFEQQNRELRERLARLENRAAGR